MSQLTADQVLKLGASELAQDNLTVLTDGVWLREYRKNEKERDWGPVEGFVERLETLGRDIGLRNLVAAAIRTRIMILAE